MTDFYSNEVKITETGVTVAKSDWTSQKFSCVYDSIDTDGWLLFTTPAQTITATFTISGDTTATPNVYWEFERPTGLSPTLPGTTTGKAQDFPAIFSTTVSSNIVNNEKIYTASISLVSLPKEYHGLKLRLTYDPFSVTKNSLTYNFLDTDETYHQAIINDPHPVIVDFYNDLSDIVVTESGTKNLQANWRQYGSSNFTYVWQYSDDNKSTWTTYTGSATELADVGTHQDPIFGILQGQNLPDGTNTEFLSVGVQFDVDYYNGASNQFVANRYYRIKVTAT